MKPSYVLLVCLKKVKATTMNEWKGEMQRKGGSTMIKSSARRIADSETLSKAQSKKPKRNNDETVECLSLPEVSYQECCKASHKTLFNDFDHSTILFRIHILHIARIEEDDQ